MPLLFCSFNWLCFDNDVCSIELDQLSKQELHGLSPLQPIAVCVSKNRNVVELERIGVFVCPTGSNSNGQVDNRATNVRHVAHQIIPLDKEFPDSTLFELILHLHIHDIDRLHEDSKVEATIQVASEIKQFEDLIRSYFSSNDAGRVRILR